MSTSPNRASNPSGKPRRKDAAMDLTTARRMLPLVKSIVADIVATRQHLTRLAHEREALDDSRRALGWASRQRRYAVHDELAQAEKALATAASELDALGVTLVGPEAAAVDFPTRVHGRPAAFSWQPGEDAVSHWHYSGEDARRPVPADWPAPPARLRAEP